MMAMMVVVMIFQAWMDEGSVPLKISHVWLNAGIDHSNDDRENVGDDDAGDEDNHGYDDDFSG